MNTIPTHDTIPVRPDETLPVAELADFLRGKLPGSDRALSVRQFGGGAANLTYLLQFGEGEEARQYVLRRPPLGPVAPSAHDMAREHRVLSVLHRAFAPAPEAFLFCGDEGVIGAPFFVMERRTGVVVRRTMPDAFAQVDDAPQRMSAALVKTLADLHQVDFEALGLGALGRPEGFIQRQIDGWQRRWHRAKIEDDPNMERLHDWLQSNQPARQEAALIHNDYKLDNVMLDPDDPGQVVAVFDWDMATLGDPLSDLGALLAYWSLPDDPPVFQALSMMPSDSRFFTRAQLVEAYAQASGRDVGHVHFYHALGLYRVAVIIQQIYIRYHRGQTQDQRFAQWGQIVPLVIQAALTVSEAM